MDPMFFLKNNITLETLEKYIGELPNRKNKILSMYFAIGEHHQHTMSEIAKHFSITPTRVGQIIHKQMRMLKHSLKKRSECS